MNSQVEQFLVMYPWITKLDTQTALYVFHAYCFSKKEVLDMVISDAKILYDRMIKI